MKSEDKSTSFHPKNPIEFSGKELTFERCRIMGILNVTPDSFYDGGRYLGIDKALIKVEEMITDGADIIDIGASSTRPGAELSSPERELKRILAVVEQIRMRFPEIIISVDTYHKRVAREVIDSGCDIINDISGGNFDPEMIPFIVSENIPYIIMHIQGEPQNMQARPQYDNVVDEIKDFLFTRGDSIVKQGNKNIVIDPGFGFGKTIEHNYKLLKHLDMFHEAGFPVLAGISRKSMINRILGTRPENALNGTTALHTIAVLKGADILRVHDVKEAKEVVTLVAQYSGR